MATSACCSLARFPVAYLPRRLAAYRLTGENKTLRGGLARFAELERVGRRHGAGGLPAAFRLEKLGFCRREAWALACGGRFLAALGLVVRGVASVLASPRAVARVIELVLGPYRGRRPTVPFPPARTVRKR